MISEAATQTDSTAGTRTPLSRERVLRGAVELADRGGIEALSMRKLGQELGVEAMSLYNHVKNKEDLLDAAIDAVVGQIELVPAAGDWRTAIRRQVMAARNVMLRHPWAPRVMESRAEPGPATIRYMESVLGILRRGGFSVDVAHHALHALGSRVFGFNQDLYDDTPPDQLSPEIAALLANEMAAQFPYISELAMAVTHEGGLGGCDDDVEFAFGLDLILDGLERIRAAA